MDQAGAMLREATDQGHMMRAKLCFEGLCDLGRGVAQDHRLAFSYPEKGAQLLPNQVILLRSTLRSTSRKLRVVLQANYT